MKQSPMFKHAIESFQHGLEHYLEGSERSRKFALLHIDQAVELMLKEKIVQLGKSIYKSNGSTLSMHEALKSLKELKLPERPRLEELHDLRNTVQHKGLTPDAESTQFYIETTYSFIKRFLEAELSTRFDSILSVSSIALMEGKRLPDVEEVLTLLQDAKDKKDPTEKIVTTYTALQRVVDTTVESSLGRVSFRRTFGEMMKAQGGDPHKIKKHLNTIIMIRNQAVHLGITPTSEQAESCYRAAWALLRKVGIARQFSKIAKSERAKKD